VHKKRLIPSLFLSFLIHLAVLTGIDVYLVPTRGMPEWPDLIPVDMVIVEEEKGGPRSDLTAKEAEFPREPLIAKAERAKGTPSTSPVEDFPGPIPKEGTFKPSLNVEQAPTPGVLPPGQEGKEAASRRVISRSLSTQQHLPEIPHSPSDQSPLIEVEKPRVLTLAEKGGIPVDSTTLERITSPLGRNRPHSESISNLLPIPTVKSPALPEEEEMMLARQPTPLQSRIGESTEPLLPGFEKRGAFEGRGRGFSILLVLDNSGSVKGQPLEGIKKSAVELVNLLGEIDRCAVITFNDEASVAIPFTSDKKRLKQKIARIMIKGRNTVLFDALDLAFLLLKKEEDKGRFVVLFSDGKDEGSQLTLREVVSRARKSKIAVFCVGYSRVEKRYLEALQGISQETGGIFAEAPHFGEIVELFRAARDVKGKKES
jgi:Mg-chelatase subunit ChlD